MNLETEVKESINDWDISLRRTHSSPVNYSDLAKPLLYGISVGVADRVVQEIKAREGPSLPGELLDLGYHEAIAKFTKEYLLRNLREHEFSVADTAVAIKLGGRTRSVQGSNLCNIIKREFGATAKELKEKYQSSPEVEDTELESLAVQEIKRYLELFRASLFKDLIIDKAIIIAKQLVAVARKNYGEHNSHEFLGLFDYSYNEAAQRFANWYLTKQIKINGNGKKAAEKSGLSEGTFRERLHTHDIKVTDVLDLEVSK